MNDSTRWQRYWRFLTHGFRRDVDEELRFHVEMRARDLERQGFTPEAARAEAEVRFGDRQRLQANLERVERKRGSRLGLSFLAEETAQDLRFAIRGIFKQPGQAFLIASSLAAGIAAVTVVLSIVDSWLLRPLPVKNPDELVIVGASSALTGSLVTKIISIPTARDLQARTDLFQDAAAFSQILETVRPPNADHGERRFLLATTGNYFSLLGAATALGRPYTTGDEAARELVIVLSHRYWTSHLGADPGVIGKTLVINRVPVTIIGVADPGFRGTDHLLEPDGFIPFAALEAVDIPMADLSRSRELGNSMVIARTKPGVSLATLSTALEVMSRQLVSSYPAIGETYRLHAVPESRARPTLEVANGALAAQIAFGGLALLVLLTACINAANLILARGTSRQNEMVVRHALGASRGRVIRQLLTENAVIAFIALGLGWALASVAVRWLSNPPMAWDLPISLGIDTNIRVFGMAILVTIGVVVVAGLGPAVAASRYDLQSTLKEGGRSGTSRGRHRLRGALVVAQVAASLVALVCAGLFASSVRQAGKIDLGFEPKGVLTFRIDPTQPGAHNEANRPLFDEILRQARLLPGAQSVAWALGAPLKGFGYFSNVSTDGEGTSTNKQGTTGVMTTSVSADYFATLRVPIVEGRAFTIADDSTGSVGIVNRHAADLLWPGKSPLGRTVRIVPGGGPIEIVGVAKDSRYLLIGEAPRPVLYRPTSQALPAGAFFFIRTSGDPASMGGAARAVVAAVDRDLAASDVYTLEEMVNNSPNGMMPFRLGASIASTVGAMATLLAIIGLYGIMAYSVVQRTREIGLRMALGAHRGTVLRSILVQGIVLAGVGIVIGGVVAVLVTRGLAGLLVGVSATDYTVFATVAVGLAVVALGSAYLPARRASRIEPVVALKADN